VVTGFLASLKMTTTYSSGAAHNYRLMYAVQPLVMQVIVRGQPIKRDVFTFGLVAPVFTARDITVLGHGDD